MNKKNGDMRSCCWGYRHELVGLVLLVLATILTLITATGLGIFAMFIVGMVLFGCKHWSWHCGPMDEHCHIDEHHIEDEIEDMMSADHRPVRKTRARKAKS